MCACVCVCVCIVRLCRLRASLADETASEMDAAVQHALAELVPEIQSTLHAEVAKAMEGLRTSLAEEAANEMSSALQEAVADLVPEVQAALQLEVEKALHAEVDKAVLAQQYEAPSQSPVEV